MNEIKYIQGDVLKQPYDCLTIIPHCCNNIGAWGAGIVRAISAIWPQPECQYREWHKNGFYVDGINHIKFSLGHVQYVQVTDKIIIANMIGQHNVGKELDRPPIRYIALAKALLSVRQKAINLNAQVCCPLFGSGLAGGDWHFIEQIIIESLVDANIRVSTYFIDPNHLPKDFADRRLALQPIKPELEDLFK